jgi:hypothetical protein
MAQKTLKERENNPITGVCTSQSLNHGYLQFGSCHVSECYQAFLPALLSINAARK